MIFVVVAACAVGRGDSSASRLFSGRNPAKCLYVSYFYLRRSRQVKACSMFFFLLLLLLLGGGPFWLTHVLSKEVCSERSFTLPMCFKKGVFREVCSKRRVQRALNLVSPK